MSEYQYYEFAALERPLTPTEMDELRAVSTRAVITPGSFVNQYHWGDLKARPADWMRRYFDAHVYFANWCCCQLWLRVPRGVFGEGELKPFAAKYGLGIEATAEHWIFDWSLAESEDYDRFGMDDGTGWMARLAPLREELLRGDLRPLYLGWLAGAAQGELADDALEPPVPPGLATLSPAQLALVEFLAIDLDLVAAAQAGSVAAPCMQDGAADAALEAWLAQWPGEDVIAVLKLLAQGRGTEAERQVRSRRAAWLRSRRPAPVDVPVPRCMAELRTAAQAVREARQEREEQARAARRAEERRQREVGLQLLMEDVPRHWASIEAQVERGIASGYAEAAQRLADLKEAHTLTGRLEAFERALQRFMERHGRRTALRRRLVEAGVCA